MGHHWFSQGLVDTRPLLETMLTLCGQFTSMFGAMSFSVNDSLLLLVIFILFFLVFFEQLSLTNALPYANCCLASAVLCGACCCLTLPAFLLSVQIVIRIDVNHTPWP